MTVRAGSGGTAAAGGLSASTNAALAALATFPGAGSFFEAPQIWLAWSNSPFDTAHYAESPNQTGASAQTALVDDFSKQRAKDGSAFLTASSLINGIKVGAIAKASSTANNINLGAIRYRSNSTDTDYNATLTTSDAYYESTVFTDSLANLLTAEAGWNKQTSTAAGTQRVEDAWVMVSYSPRQLGTAQFAGTGSLSAATRAQLAALAEFDGAGSLSAAATAKLAAAATFQGAGSLSAADVLALAAAATFAGSGSLSVNLLTFVFDATEAFAGAGNLAATGTLLATAAASFAGSGNLSANGVLAARAAAAFAGIGSLAVDAQHLKAAQAAFSGAGSLSANLLTYIYLTAERFDGAGSLAADAALISGGAAQQGTAEFDGAGSLAVDAKLLLNALAAFSGASGFSVAAVLRESAAAALAGSSDLSAAAILAESAAATLSGAGGLSVDLVRSIPGILATFAGAGNLAATARLANAAAATFSGVGSLSAAAVSRLTAAAAFVGSGSLSASANLNLAGNATFSGAGSLSAHLERPASLISAAFAGAGSLAASAKLRAAAFIDLSGAGNLSAGARLIERAAATLSGTGDLSAYANLRQVAAATFAGAGSVAVDLIFPTFRFANFDGAGILSALANMKMAAASTFSGSGGMYANLIFTTARAFSGLTFPAFLSPAVVLVENYGHQRSGASIRTSMESGFDRVRLVERNPLRTLTASIEFTDDQAEYFDAWYAYREKNGEIWFNIDLPIEGTPRTVLARFVGEPTQRPLSPVADRWVLTAQFEINDTNVVSRNLFTPPDIGVFPSDIIGDADILEDGFQHKLEAAGDRTDQSVEGTPRFRTRTLTPFRSMTVAWWLDESQVAYFNEWLEYRARHEAAFFSIDVPIESATYRTVRARFASPPRFTAVEYNLYRCTAELEARDINVTTPEVLEVYETLGTDIFGLEEAVEDLTLDPYFDAWDELP